MLRLPIGSPSVGHSDRLRPLKRSSESAAGHKNSLRPSSRSADFLPISNRRGGAILGVAAALLLVLADWPFSLHRPSELAWAGTLEPRQQWDVSVRYDPNLYASATDTQVTYDDVVAQGYDDGYGPKAYKQFEAALSPYGTWVDDAALGRVWIPSIDLVGTTFCPYGTKGNWVLTEYGWTWETEWAWGWAPFHYGRWTTLKGRGWAWVPGTLWGPAWVAWRTGRHYVGWAPLPPRGIHLGRPIGPRSPWRFIRAQDLGRATPEYVPLRIVPSLFGTTTALSKGRSIRIGNLNVRVSVGPPGLDRQTVAPPLAVAAPNAMPRLEIKPRLGAAVESRPWAVAGALEQTPVYRWQAPNGS
jgi:hypothetical protein